MNEFDIIVISNSTYNYLWPIINDYCKDLNIYVSLCIEDNYDIDTSFCNNIRIIRYDPNVSYSQRMIQILSLLNSDYVLLFHDVDIVLNLNVELLKRYIETMKLHSIDRLSLGVYNHKNEIDIINHKGVSFCNLKDHKSLNFFTPFDHSASIYNKQSSLELYNHFKKESYASIELNGNVQNYVRKCMKSFGIQKNDSLKLIYHRGFVYTSDFNFLHITVQGRTLQPRMYFDLQDTFHKIMRKYKLDFLLSWPSVHIKKNVL